MLIRKGGRGAAHCQYITGKQPTQAQGTCGLHITVVNLVIGGGRQAGNTQRARTVRCNLNGIYNQVGVGQRHGVVAHISAVDR